SRWIVNRIKPIEIQTSGRYEVTVIPPQEKDRFPVLLATNGLALSTEQKSLLESYVERNWWLIAARVAPAEQGVSQSHTPQPAERESPAKGQKRELPPLIISFGSDKCIYPLTLSTAAERPAELSLFVFAGVPLMSRAMFEKKYEESLKHQPVGSQCN